MSRLDTRHDRPSRSHGLGTLLAALIGVAGAYLIAAWLDCSTADGVALCLAPVAMPSPYRRLYRAWLRWRIRRAEQQVQRCKRRQLMEAAHRIAAEDELIRLQRCHHETLRHCGVHHG